MSSCKLKCRRADSLVPRGARPQDASGRTSLIRSYSNKHRAAYDRETVIAIFKAAPVVHVGFNSLDGQPREFPPRL